MVIANSIQEYIDLFISGRSLYVISVSKELKESLILYVEENKDKSNDLLCLYATWLLEGIFLDKNQETAIQIYKALVAQGNACAQVHLGICYLNGQGVATSLTKTYSLLNDSAMQEYAPAQYLLGELKSVTENHTEAVSWYRKAAEQGHTVAQYSLGTCYKRGIGVALDYTEAVFWYTKSAKQGYENAQLSLAICYSKGQGVTQDDVEAVSWCRKAADQGYDRAQYMLGDCYYEGKGVTQDDVEAVSWYRKAADQGCDIAQHKLGDCYEKGRGVPKNHEAAVYWYRKAALAI